MVVIVSSVDVWLTLHNYYIYTLSPLALQYTPSAQIAIVVQFQKSWYQNVRLALHVYMYAQFQPN